MLEKTVKQLRQKLQRKLNNANAEVTIDQWIILDLLHKEDGVNQNELAASAYKDAPTVTRIIDLLCKKKFTERVPDATDRRRFNIKLTELGKQKINNLLPLVQSFRKKGWGDLTFEDYQTLIRILKTISQNVQTALRDD